MKNYEKYKDIIRSYESSVNFCTNFVKPYILKSEHCNGIDCTKCRMIQAIWLLEDYEEPEEPEIDWSKVKVDTPILVREYEEQDWVKRYFAKYEDGTVHAWRDGCTSWTEENASAWKYAKLPEDEEKPEVDWNKIKVDTPILVRDSKDSKWLRRYFAKYEDEKVYAWLGETTSYDACGQVAKWKYAKLAESEEE